MENLYKNRPIDLAFYEAASTGTVEELKGLLEQGANPHTAIYFNYLDVEPYDYDYPIHQAARNSDVEVIKFLVSLGVNPCAEDLYGREPLSYVNTLEVAQYLVELGNNPTLGDDDGGNVIYYAALNPDVQLLEYLLSQGADIDTGSDMTGLIVVLEEGTLDRVKFFLEHGADLEFAIDYVNRDKIKPEILHYLQSIGFDPNSMNDYDE